MPTPLQDLSKRSSTQQNYELLLLTLAEEPSGVIADSSGRATTVLMGKLPFEVSNATINPMLRRLEETGWIAVDRRGRRTYRIALLETAEARHPRVRLPARADVEDDAEVVAEEVSPELANEQEELGMRPGRLAARIERSIPELVDQAVKRALTESIVAGLTIVSEHLGIRTEDAGRLNQLEAALEQARQQVAELETSLSQERALNEFLREELSATLKKTPEGKLTSKTLFLHQLPEEYRDLGRHALEHGWSIVRTRGGGHLAWMAPDGKGLYYTASTPSDWRTVRNDRAGLERLGLPKL